MTNRDKSLDLQTAANTYHRALDFFGYDRRRLDGAQKAYFNTVAMDYIVQLERAYGGESNSSEGGESDE